MERIVGVSTPLPPLIHPIIRSFFFSQSPSDFLSLPGYIYSSFCFLAFDPDIEKLPVFFIIDYFSTLFVLSQPEYNNNTYFCVDVI